MQFSAANYIHSTFISTGNMFKFLIYCDILEKIPFTMSCIRQIPLYTQNLL